MYTPACKQIENTQRRCSYVAFIDRSKEYRSTTNKGQFHTRYPQTKHNRIYTATCNQIENTRRRCPDVAFIYNIKSTYQQQTNGFTFILEYISYANQLSRYFECEMQNSKNNFLPLVEQELPTLPEHLSSPRFQWGSCYSIISFMCNILQIVVCSFVLFILNIALSVLLRFTNSDYPFSILDLCLSYYRFIK